MAPEKVNRVYQKDLYQDEVVFKIRMDADKFEHGDMVKIEAEKLTDDEVEKEVENE